MASHNIVDAFNDCIDRLRAGQSLGDCLRAYPEHADTLRSLLESAMLVRQARPAMPVGARERVRERVMQSPVRPRTRWIFAPRGLTWAAALVVLLGFVVVLLLVNRDGAPSAQVEPFPPHTSTPTATVTSSPTATPSVTATATPTVTRTASLAPTATLMSTLMATNAPSPTAQPVTCAFEVMARSINLRNGPGTGYAVVGAASSGDVLTVLARHTSGEWFQVRLYEGEAWVAGSLGTLNGACGNLPISTVPLISSPDTNGSDMDDSDDDEDDDSDDGENDSDSAGDEIDDSEDSGKSDD